MKDVIVNLKIPIDRYGGMLLDSKIVNMFMDSIRCTLEEQSKEKDRDDLIAYRALGTVEEFAAYKQTVDYAKAKVKEIQDRIDARAGDNYHDETKRTLILEERQGAYITILEAAEAALAAKEEME